MFVYFVFNFSNCMFMFMFLVFNFRIVCRFSCFWSSIFELYVDFHVFCLPFFMLLFHVIVSSFFILFYGLYLSNNYGCSCLQLLLFMAVTIHVFRVFSNYFFNLFFIVLLSVYSIWEVALVDLVAPEARIIPAVVIVALVVVVIFNLCILRFFWEVYLLPPSHLICSIFHFGMSYLICIISIFGL